MIQKEILEASEALIKKQKELNNNFTIANKNQRNATTTSGKYTKQGKFIKKHMEKLDKNLLAINKTQLDTFKHKYIQQK